MVGNDTVDRAVQKSLQHCFTVFFRPERRIHTVIRITAEHRFLCHQEIVRTGFTGHLDTLCFGVTNDLHAAVSADVSDMNRHIGRGRQNDLPCGDIVFRSPIHASDTQRFRSHAAVHNAAVDNGQIFTMRNNRQPQCIALNQSLPHGFCTLYRSAVVGNGTDAGIFQRRIVAHFLAFQPLGNAAHGVNLHAGISCFFADIADSVYVVDCRRGIRHACHAGDAASQCRCGTGEDVLFMCLPGVTQMHMHIKQPRQCCQAGAVNDKVGRFVQIFSQLCDHAVLNQHVTTGRNAALHQLYITNQNGLLHSFLISASVF